MLELARPGDWEAVNALASEVHGLHVGWRPDLYEPQEEVYPEVRFLAEIKDRNLYAAKLGGVVVGYTLLKIREYDHPGLVRRRTMVVEEFCVHESCRGQGIGTKMMEDVRALAMAFRCRDLQLGVYPQNDGAVAFYQKCGFQIQNIMMQRNI